MVAKNYTPEKGDLVWLNFTPQSGHEQSGKRPAVVLSPSKYNKKTGLLIACPVNGKIKGYPFEIIINGRKISGAILADQIKSLDWRSRKASFIEKIREDSFTELQEKLKLLLFS